MGPPTPRKPLSFLSLPPEVRLQIYRLLTFPKNPFRRHLRTNLPEAAFSFHSAILRTCRLISAEALTVFWGENWWDVDICHSFSYFRQFYLTVDAARQFSLMRRFRLRFVWNQNILSEYPSYGLQNYIRDTYEYAVKVMEVVPRLPGLRVEVCWSDTVCTGTWEEKRCVLEALKVLPPDCVYTVGSIFSSNKVSCVEFKAWLDGVMNSRYIQEVDTKGGYEESLVIKY